MTSPRPYSARCALPLERWRLSARVWMLALLPLLLWSVIGSAMHTHRADGSEVSWWNVTSIQEVSEQSSTHSHQQALSQDEHTHLAVNNALCLLCHWSSFAPLHAVSVTHSVVFRDFATTPPFSQRVVLSDVPCNRDNRGPPFLI